MPLAAPAAQQYHDTDPMLYSHEERIQRLESGIGVLSTQVATVITRQEGMSQRMDDGFKLVAEEIRGCVAPLAVQITDHLKRDDERFGELVPALKGTQEAVRHYQEQAEAREEQKKKRKERWLSWGKAVVAVLGAGLGILVKELTKYLWKRFSHTHG